MVRRGRYGQAPRGAGANLASTIIAIAQQFQAQREQNIMDAWKNGGTFEGKPVTDEMVLSFWRERLGEVDKRDPQYDVYKNTVTQTEYSVAESKMSTWYAQSKGEAGDDRRMAKFYSDWATKIPKDSEFFRVLQRDAAQFIRSAIAKEKAAAAGSGGGRRGSGGPTAAQLKAKAYQDSQAKTYNDYERVGDFLTNTFTQAAKGNALIGMGSTQDLTNFDPTDPGHFLDIISQVSAHPDQPVYYTAGGAVTGQAILDVLKQLDPHFDGNLTMDYYGKSLGNSLVGMQNRLDLATSTSHKTDQKAIAKAIGARTELGRQANAWPIEQSYQQLRTNFLKTWGNPTTTPDQKLAAWQTYSTGLVNLANDPKHPADQNTATRLLAEVNGDGGVDSLAESFSGERSADHSSLNGTSQGDIADTHASLANLVAQQQAVVSGQAVWSMGTTDSQGVFHPGAGSEIGAADPYAVQQSSPEGAVQVWLTQAGGRPIPVWVAGKTVTAQVVDADGFRVDATNPDATKVATAYDVTIDGQSTRLYSYTMPGGRTLYTTDAPWGPNVQVHDTGGAIQISVRLSTVPSEDTIGSNPAFTVVRDENGDPTGKITVDPSTIVLTQTDPTRYFAGPDPNVDSLSPSIALHLGSSEARSDLVDLQQDAGFRHGVDQDLRLAAGGQYDPATGTVLGGDPALYNEGAAQAGFAYRINDPRSTGLGPAGGEVFFPRTTTRGAFEVVGPTPFDSPDVGIGGGALSPPRGASASGQLPSDAARGTAFDGLASIFQPGTDRVQPSTPSQDGLTLVTPQQLRVPSPPKPDTVATNTMVAPTPAPQVSPAAPLPPVIPVPTPIPLDGLTPTPTPTPAPTAAASGGYGSQDLVTRGVTYVPPAPPKPKTGASQPRPAQPKTGSRAV